MIVHVCGEFEFREVFWESKLRESPEKSALPPCRLAFTTLTVKLVATESLRVLGALSYPLFTSQLRVLTSTGRPVPDQEVYSLPKITSKTEGWDACRSRRLPLPSQLHRSFVTLVLVLMAVFLSVLQEVRGPVTVSSGWEKVPRQSELRSEDQMHEKHWEARSFSTWVTCRSVSQGSYGSVDKSAAVGASVSLLGDSASRSLGKNNQSETSSVKWFRHFIHGVEKQF